MSLLTWFIIAVYSRTLALYPRRFKDEFADEMKVVFRDSVNDAVEGGMLSLLVVSLRELGNLPASILREFWYEFERKGTNMVTNGKVDPKSVVDGGTSYWDALIGTLPFALFGVVCMIGKIRVPWIGIYADLIFNFFVLLGLLIGLVKAFPRWAYSYLGWSLVFAWWWTDMGTYGLRIFGFRIDYWTWQIWIPLLATLGLALLWTRSLHPLRQLIRNIWQDWTLLSLAMYTFVGFVALLYDENHHPYLFAFMTVSTLIVSGGAWFFLRERQIRKRIIALLSSFVAIAIIGAISETTWDWRAYYGLPPQPHVVWYVSALRTILILAIWSAILFWPALVGLARHSFNNSKTT